MPRASPCKSEGHDPVGNVMPDVRMAKEGNSVARAPAAGDLFAILAEFDIVFRHVANPSELNSSNPAKVRCEVEEQPVDSVKVLGHFLQQHDMARQPRHQGGAGQHGEGGEIESGARVLVQRGLLAGAVARQPGQRTAHRHFATIAAHVDRHRRMDRLADPRAVQPAEQGTRVRVAQPGLALRWRLQPGNGIFGDPRRAIAAASEPHRIEGRIVAAFDQRGQALFVGPGEMAVAEEALRVEMQLQPGEVRSQRTDPRGVLFGQAARGRTDGNAKHDRFLAGMLGKAQLSFQPGPHTAARMTDLTSHPWFFCGIGGSGMLPLALILRGMGAEIAGSDRSRDQGRTPEKFAWLESLGLTLHPQDGSGITSGAQTLVASAAVEDTVPEVIRAKELGCPRISRAELLAALFNAAPTGIAIGGTSGKSTVTGMAGWIMDRAGRDPTIMNGAVMKNYAGPDAPFASARIGAGGVFVSEVDESDGSIALYRPKVAALLNVSLDHKSMEELRGLFGDFLGAAEVAAVNFDDVEARALAARARQVVSFGIDSAEADIAVEAGSLVEGPVSLAATIADRRDDSHHALTLQVPGRHNLANALAAIAACNAAGVPVGEAVAALAGFAGLARRFDIIGTSPSGVTVIDDFGHNPDKVAATLRTLKSQPGRVIAFFQPHGYGPLRQMGHELADVFARLLGQEDFTILCDPVYFGGTVDRSEGSERIVRLIGEAGGLAEYVPARDDCATRIFGLARPGDRIVVMGARDDTLTVFAKSLLARLP